MSKANWQPIEQCKACLTPVEWQWLHHAGSLTTRLRALTQGRIQHVLQHEAWAMPMAEEQAALSLLNERAWVREINWEYNGTLWVQGRVVIPETCLKANRGELIELKNQSLGDVIFQDPTLQRKTLDVCQLDKTHLYYQHAKLRAGLMPATLWSRRSVFSYHRQSLLVVETLLPAIYQFEAHEYA